MSKPDVKVIDIGPVRSPLDVLRDPPKFCPPPVDLTGIQKETKESVRFFLYEPKSKLFVKRDGIEKYWSATDHSAKAFAHLTFNLNEAYSVISNKEAQAHLKVIINGCGFAAIGTNRGTVELDHSLGCKVDNSPLCVIINVKWLVVKEVTCSYSW